MPTRHILASTHSPHVIHVATYMSTPETPRAPETQNPNPGISPVGQKKKGESERWGGLD